MKTCIVYLQHKSICPSPFPPTPNKDKDNQKELNIEKLLSKFIIFFKYLVYIIDLKLTTRERKTKLKSWKYTPFLHMHKNQ